MHSPRSAMNNPSGTDASSLPDDLTEWSQFLPSEPLETEPSLSETVVSVSSPVTQTLQRLALNWMMFSLMGTWATGTVGLLALSNLVNVPPEPDCDNLDRRSSSRARLTCLQEEIAAGNAEARLSGLGWVGHWEPTHPLFSESMELLETWSIPVLQEARQAQATGKLIQAIDLASRIPVNSPRFLEAQDLLERLTQSQQKIAAKLYEDAQKSLQDKHWAKAFQILSEIEALDHQVFKTGLSEQLAQQLEAERQATRIFNRAVRQHTLGTPEDRGYAIAIASQIAPETYLWETAQGLINQWSDELFPTVQHRLETGNFNGAIALARQIAKNPDRKAVAQDWLTVAWAEKLATVSLAETTAPLTKSVGLYPAVLATKSIHPESVWRSSAMAYAQRWQIHLLEAWSHKADYLSLSRIYDLKTGQHPLSRPGAIDHHRNGRIKPQPQVFQPLFPEQHYIPSFVAM